MQMITYRNASEYDVLNKDLTKVEENISITLKDDTEMIRPTIITSNNISNNYNYVYLSAFNRYYFVKGKSYSQQRYYVQLEVDPLMSYKDAIKSLVVIANRCSQKFNLYQVDPEVPQLAPNVIATQKFPYGFGGYSFVLAVTGGGRPPEPEPNEEEVTENVG